MGTLEFIADIIKATVWPLSVLAVVLILRRPLSGAIRLIRRLKYQDIEMEFHHGVAELVRAADSHLPVADVAAKEKDEQSKLGELAVISPNNAVVEAWRRLENRLVDLARERGLDVAAAVWTMPAVLSGFLLCDGHISESQHDMIVRAKELRNRITHSPRLEVSGDEAMRYVEVTGRLCASLGSAPGC